MRKKVTLTLGFLLAGLLATAAGAQPPASKVMVGQSRMVSAPVTVTAVGTVRAVRRSNIAAEVEGVVAEMPVRQGDYVEQGAVLCRLNADTLRFELAAAEARFAALEARHAELVAGTRAEQLTRLKALLDEAIAGADRWEFEMQRVEKFYKGQISNEKEYQDTESSLRQAREQKIAAQASYEEAVNGPRKEVIAQAAFEVKEQQALVNRLQTDLKKTAIRAPYAGYVLELATEVGEWVGLGGEVLELADLSTVLVEVGAPEYALPFLQLGDPARVQVDALERSFEGTVKHVIRQADPEARTFPLQIEIDNTERLLAGGMFARATFRAGTPRETVAVPQDALVEQRGIPHVGLVMPGQQGGMTALLVPVTVGLTTEGWTPITSPNVQPGMTVVTHGNERLYPFPSPILIVDEQGRPVQTAAPAGAPGRPNHEAPAPDTGQRNPDAQNPPEHGGQHPPRAREKD